MISLPVFALIKIPYLLFVFFLILLVIFTWNCGILSGLFKSVLFGKLQIDIIEE